MTVVVYKDNAIASDSAVINGYGTVLGGFQKCGARQINGVAYFFGSTGETAYCQKFMTWCNGLGLEKHLEGEVDNLPLIQPPGANEHCTGIVCFGSKALRFEGNNPPIEIYGDIFSVGSGDMYALGALEAGVDALAATRIAVKLDQLSGGEIHHHYLFGSELVSEKLPA